MNMIMKKVEYEKFAEFVSLLVKEMLDSSFVVKRECTSKDCRKQEHTLTIVDSASTGMFPVVFHLEQLFAIYEKQGNLFDIATYIVRLFHECRQKFSILMGATTYESLKDNICFKLIHYENNKEYLKTVPYRRYLDLAVVYYAAFEDENSSWILKRSIDIDLALECGLDEAMLWQLAYENTRRMINPEVRTMYEELQDFGYEDQVIDSHLYVYGRKKNMYGAAALLYPEILHQFAMEKDSNLYILPSSIYECLICLDDGRSNAEYLNAQVKEVNNESVADEDVLSDHVYYYDRVAREIRF